MGKQLSLFGDTAPEEPLGFEWSYSRRETLERCPRSYYYTYYGSRVNVAKQEKDKEQIRALKGLTNRHMRAGDILHRIASTHLKRLNQGTDSNASSLIEWARSLFQEDIAYSKDPAGNASLAEKKFPPAHLLEYFYEEADADELVAKSEQRLVSALERFFGEEALKRFHAGAQHPDAQIEANVRFSDGPHRFRGKIDLSYPEGDRRTTVDWKLGSSYASEDSLQMFSYGIAAVHEYELVPEQLQLWRVHLGSMTVEPQDFTESQYRRARARMIQDLQQMVLLEGYGRDGVAEAFTPYAHPKVCCLCPFQAVCPMEEVM